MARIIIEGPDGSGKSYTARFLERAVSLPVFPTQGPPKTPEEIVKRVRLFFELDNYIFDRCPLISEMVYGPIIRGNHIFDRSWLSRFNDKSDFFVYCRPSIDTIIKTKLSSKKHKPQNHVDKVIEKHKEIIKAYDSIVCSLPNLIHFNRDTQTPEELCVGLTLQLKKAKFK